MLRETHLRTLSGINIAKIDTLTQMINDASKSQTKKKKKPLFDFQCKCERSRKKYKTLIRKKKTGHDEAALIQKRSYNYGK